MMSSSGPSVVEAATEESETTTTTSSSSTTTVPPTTAPEEVEEDDNAELMSCSEDPILSDGDPLEDYATIVLDPVHSISPEFEPPDLVDLDPPDVPGEIQVRELMVEDLTGLLTAANDADAPLTLVSGYRSYDYQERLYNNSLEEEGEAAGDTTARPGHSEHQLGTTVDVLTPGMVELSADFGETPAGQWLAGNAGDYGFVISYPADSKETTCYDYEPWHIRYVGTDLAAQIDESGLTPREWMLLENAGS